MHISSDYLKSQDAKLVMDSVQPCQFRGAFHPVGGVALVLSATEKNLLWLRYQMRTSCVMRLVRPRVTKCITVRGHVEYTLCVCHVQ
jgi:hypothetical protein